MRLEIRGKEFKIDLVNNYCSRIYHEELFPMIVEHGALLTDAEKDASIAIAMSEDRTEEMRKQAGILKEKKARAKELDDKVYMMRFELIQELLESNDYEYDKAWWERRTSPEDVNEFILCCLQPEYQKVKGNKKKVL